MKRQQYLKKYEIKSEINIVPFLDILLVLLIIFMMMPSKLFIQQQNFEVHVSNSDKKTDSIKNKKIFIIIKILGSNIYDLIINDTKLSSVSSNQLISKIHSIKNTNPKLACLISANKEEKYNEIVQVLNILNDIGIHSIGMITH